MHDPKKLEELEIIGINRLKVLAVSSQKLTDIIAALQFVESRIDRGNDQPGDLNTFLNNLVKRTEEVYGK